MSNQVTTPFVSKRPRELAAAHDMTPVYAAGCSKLMQVKRGDLNTDSNGLRNITFVSFGAGQ